MPSTINRSSPLETRIEQYAVRRGWVLGTSAAFVLCGLLYVFEWSPVVRHRPSLWIMPSDLWTTYAASAAAVHGHLASVYGSGFLAFPGFLVVLAPVAALSGRFSTTYVQVTNHGLPVVGGAVYSSPGTPTILYDGVTRGGDLYAVHQGVFLLLFAYVLVVSCTLLFACDGLAEELGVVRWRRAVLSVVEAVLLWGVVVVAGHPEDVLAVALAVWSLTRAFQGRWTAAGWLFGAAVAVQPLVIVLFPLLLALGGRDRVLGLVVRGAVPAAVVLAVPLVADAHDTLHAWVDQPTFPNIPFNYRTAWTPFAPHLGGSGPTETVGGGPVRLVALALAAGIGWWSLRWRQRHEMIVWAAALALALRVYTESVMTAYYTWPALAVGVLIAGRATTRRFVVALAAAAVTLVVGQWLINSYVWWAVQVVGVSIILAAAASPRPVVEAPPAPRAKRPPGSAGGARRPARR